MLLNTVLFLALSHYRDDKVVAQLQSQQAALATQLQQQQGNMQAALQAQQVQMQAQQAQQLARALEVRNISWHKP
jgi:uncharacterized membrane protein